jgi:hypothetical protein
MIIVRPSGSTMTTSGRCAPPDTGELGGLFGNFLQQRGFTLLELGGFDGCRLAAVLERVQSLRLFAGLPRQSIEAFSEPRHFQLCRE